MVDIAKAIRVGRANKNINQTELAKRVGISAPSAVSAWESGQKIPSGDVLIKVMVELDIVTEIFPDYIKKAEARKMFNDFREEFERDIVPAREALKRLEKVEERLDKIEEKKGNGKAKEEVIRKRGKVR